MLLFHPDIIPKHIFECHIQLAKLLNVLHQKIVGYLYPVLNDSFQTYFYTKLCWTKTEGNQIMVTIGKQTNFPSQENNKKKILICFMYRKKVKWFWIVLSFTYWFITVGHFVVLFGAR